MIGVHSQTKLNLTDKCECAGDQPASSLKNIYFWDSNS